MQRRYSTLLLILIIIFTSSSFPLSAQAEERGSENNSIYYVDVENGDDSNDGSIEQPFKTIASASNVMTSGDQCVIREGVYREKITPKVNNVTYKAYEGEEVIIDGSTVISEWVVDEGNVYVASNISLDLGHKNQIFNKGKAIVEARTPNVTKSLDTGDWLFDPGDLYSAYKGSTVWHQGTTIPRGEDGLVSSDKVWLKSSNLNQSSLDVAGAKIWYLSKHHAGWSNWMGKVADHSGDKINIETDMHDLWWHACSPRNNGKFYLSGLKSFLDHNDEWYYDQQEQKLYYYTSESIEDQEISYQRETYGIDLSNRQGVLIEGLKLVGCSILTNEASHYNTINKVDARYIGHASQATGYHETLVKETGIVLNGTHNMISNSVIKYSAGNGIALLGSYNAVMNNIIEGCNYLGVYCANVYIDGDHLLIKNNTLKKGGRSLITCSKHFLDSKVIYNVFEDSMVVSNDGGQLYISYLDGDNTEIAYNIFREGTKPGTHQAALYLDNNCSGIIAHHNLMHDINNWGIQFNIPQEYSLLYHNTLVGSNKGGYIGSYWDTKQPQTGDTLGNRMENNVYYNTNETKGEIVFKNNVSNSQDIFKDAPTNDYRLKDSFVAEHKVQAIEGISHLGSDQLTIPGAFDEEINWSEDVGVQSSDMTYDMDNYEELMTSYSNRLNNYGFEYGDLRSWNKSGNGQVDVIYDPTQNGFMNDYSDTYTGWHALWMKEGTSQVSQQVEGIIKDRVYIVNAWVRNDNNATMSLTAESGSRTVTETKLTSDGKYRRVTAYIVPETEAMNISIAKTSTGHEKVRVDLVGVQLTDLDPDNFITVPITDEPQGYWNFESNIQDQSYVGNKVSYIGDNETYVTGVIQNTKGIYFNDSDYMSVKSKNNISFGPASNPFTVSCWIKTTEQGDDYPNKGFDRVDILSKGRQNGSNANNDYELYLNNGKLAFSRWDQGQEKDFSITDEDGMAINDGSWHHIAFVNEASNVHKLYVDGMLVEESSQAWSEQSATLEPLEIGKRSNAQWSENLYQGAIDELYIYRRGLSAQEIMEQVGMQPSGQWHFEDSIEDSSSNSNTSNFVGDEEVYMEGHVDGTKAVSFSGDSYIEVDSASGISFGPSSNPFTIACWIKTTEQGDDYPNKGFSRVDFLAKGRAVGSSANNDYELYLNEGKLAFARWDQELGIDYIITDSDGVAINDGIWHHIAFVNEANNVHKLYVDGVLVEVSSEEWSEQTGTDEKLEIGRRSNAQWSQNYYEGELDELYIYKASLTQEEILNLME